MPPVGLSASKEISIKYMLFMSKVIRLNNFDSILKKPFYERTAKPQCLKVKSIL